MEHILVVDDDPIDATILRFLLQGEGYTVTAAESAERALASLDHTDYDLILLDIIMPEMDGLELCRRIRITRHVPIMFLTVRSDVADKVLGLRVGGDDYLAKPYHPVELLARIRALLRRTGQAAQSALELWRNTLTLDLTEQTVALHRTGTLVRLTPTEARLLHVLLTNAGHRIIRDALAIKVWGADYEHVSDQLDVAIERLRTKLDEDPSEPTMIQTIPGFGYRFVSPKAPPTA